MKNLLLALLLAAAASVGSARAMTIDITTWTDETFAFDVVWGTDPIAGWGSASVHYGPFGRSITALSLPRDPGYPSPTFVEVFADVPEPSQTTHFVSHVVFYFNPPAVAFADATDINVEFGPPTSLTATPDGYGAHFVYGKLPETPNGVPDAGSSAALLGLAVIGCVGMRRVLVR